MRLLPWKKVGLPWALDLRSIAAFRIAIASALLLDLYIRARDLSAHYTSLGVLPITAQRQYYDITSYFLSFHSLADGATYISVLFALHALFTIGMLVGYQTKLMNFLTWIFTLSLQQRNPMILQGGDVLLRCYLFWLLFLPTSYRYSVDRLQHPDRFDDARFKNGTFSGFSALAIVVQMALVYAMATIIKIKSPSWTSGYAVHYALNLEHFATSLGYSVRNLHWLTHGFTYLTLVFEGVFPFLILLFPPYAAVRYVAAFSVAGFHLGLALFLSVGLFSWLAPLQGILLLPAAFWNKFERSVAPVFDRLGDLLQLIARTHPKPNYEDPPRALTWLQHGLVAFAMAGVIAWNWQTINTDNPNITNFVKMPLQALGLDQRWAMFANPQYDTGWFSMPGRLADGTAVELMRNDGVAFLEPPMQIPSETYRSDRWRKYLVNILWDRMAPHRTQLSNGLCKMWNATHPADKRLVALQILYFSSAIKESGIDDKISMRVLANAECESDQILRNQSWFKDLSSAAPQSRSERVLAWGMASP